MPLLIRQSERVREIIINRPERRNALNALTIKELTQAFAQASKDNGVGCILFSGQGTEAFCAGADLKELEEYSTLTQRKKFFGSLATLIATMNKSPKPIVAKVHGAALAGGCGLAAASDLTLASENAIFGLPEIAIGLVPMVVAAPIERAIGRKALADLMLSGESISAARALEIGLISRLSNETELDGLAMNLAQKISKRSPKALALAKTALYEISEREYFKLLTSLPEKIAKLSRGEEAQQGIRAFLDRKK